MVLFKWNPLLDLFQQPSVDEIVVGHFPLEVGNRVFTLIEQLKFLLFLSIFLVRSAGSFSFSLTCINHEFRHLVSGILLQVQIDIKACLDLTAFHIFLFFLILFTRQLRENLWSHVFKITSVCKRFGIVQIHGLFNGV